MKAVNEDPALLRSVWGGCDYTLALDQTLLGGLESEARWALNRRKAAHATLPNFLEFVDALPLLDVQRDAVSVLLP